MEGQTSAIASADAPFLYVDGAPCFGIREGIIQVTLDAIRLQHGTDSVLTDNVIVGHLRLSVPAARRLINALQGAILLGEKPVGAAN